MLQCRPQMTWIKFWCLLTLMCPRPETTFFWACYSIFLYPFLSFNCWHRLWMASVKDQLNFSASHTILSENDIYGWSLTRSSFLNLLPSLLISSASKFDAISICKLTSLPILIMFGSQVVITNKWERFFPIKRITLLVMFYIRGSFKKLRLLFRYFSCWKLFLLFFTFFNDQIRILQWSSARGMKSGQRNWIISLFLRSWRCQFLSGLKLSQII